MSRLITLAAAVGTLCLTQLALTGAAVPPSGPRPAVSAKAGDGAFSGNRKVAISFEYSAPAFLWLDPEGRLAGNVELTDRSLFVLAPVGDQHQIRTAVGAPACLGIKHMADGPDKVVAAVCNPAAAGQLFTFAQRTDKDSQGRRKFGILNAESELTFSSLDGVHMQPRGCYPAVGFALVDKGPAR